MTQGSSQSSADSSVKSPPRGGGQHQGEDTSLAIPEEINRFVQHKLYPALAYLLVPPGDFAEDGTVSRMALLSSLYKVFERC